MQHSPQEIKTKLGEAVDPEGNVLNMAAVVEVIGLLERTPLTKEALEQTRIGRTVNLLRKKTDNDDIARRAKRLVKKWQKLVQNHLEAVRNTNSPLNGIRCNSPVVNGSVKSDEQANSPADLSAKLDRKARGTKRKRLSVDSLSPGETQGNEELGNKDNTSCNEKNYENNGSQHSSLISTQSSIDSEESLTASAECSQNSETNFLKQINTDDGGCHQESTLVKSDRATIDKNTCSTADIAPSAETNNSDHTDVRWEGKDIGLQTDDIVERGDENIENPPCPSLDVELQANGINGRFGEDGKWYSWSETMSYNEGSLIILPYVLLE
ncbi:mediator of RNA polymerase II transcription subunit 26-like [Dendronephthya gigantea]|uniref:mediator of RNA polymerase II transcription subunit 26-like n=1 Tax=Dendronephthya gigantea TaxID=151771 RepID=UPI00106D39EC|nr:mediator of RNA polymerase II transcription subunit 26-like [Dendronephthya gigantea]